MLQNMFSKTKYSINMGCSFFCPPKFTWWKYWYHKIMKHIKYHIRFQCLYFIICETNSEEHHSISNKMSSNKPVRPNSFIFNSHLRMKHCTQEGGSFVCRYGDNNVCSTLPVEGVNDLDYEHHVFKHHVTHGKTHSRKSSTRSEPQAERWTLHTTAQNLPAVLNDPKQGKQVSSSLVNNLIEFLMNFSW